MNPEEEFITSFVPLLRRYLLSRNIQSLTEQLNILEEQLNAIFSSRNHYDTINKESEESEESEENEDSEDSQNTGDGPLIVDLTLNDLDKEVLEYISQELGMSSIEELLLKRPEFNDPITSITISR